MKHLLIFVLILTVAGCGPRYDEVVQNVCIPINENENVDIELLAKKNGYDIEDTREVCRQHLRERMIELDENMRILGL